MAQIVDVGQVWHTAFENSPISMGLLSTEGRWLAVNSAFCQMLGRTRDELMAIPFAAYTLPVDIDADADLIRQCFQRQINHYRILKRYLHADGHTVWGDLSVALVRDEDDRATYFIVQILDVSGQHESEARLAEALSELRRQAQLVEATFEGVDIGLCQIDPGGRYLRVNGAHRDFMRLGFPEGHAGFAGQMGEVYGPDGVTRLTREEMPSIRGIQGEDFDHQQIWVGPPGGPRRALSVSSRCIRDAEGGLVTVSLAYKDVTELIMALQVKESFVSSVSHELRTPLTSVLGHLEMLLERDDLPREALAQLSVVERNSLRLKRLVSDLLEVAAGREGDLTIRRASVDLVRTVREGVASMAAQAATKGLEVTLRAPERLIAFADSERLRQVLDNLLSNALKYTPSGGVVVVALEGIDGEVRLSVTDDGMGFEPGFEEKAFSRFYRGRQVRALQIQGTGLGLSIVHTIVTLHGGTVAIDSEPGQGSTVTVTLPHAAD